MSNAHNGRREVMPSGLVIENPSTMHDPAPLDYSQIAIVPAGERCNWLSVLWRVGLCCTNPRGIHV
ncbi:hypothetical protein, partial [Loktanella fryxellensis]|uniref:hypothetical protein n=1 Tax=Loktanella fryxellensis TaxID=245187 RepID=UPI001C43466B